MDENFREEGLEDLNGLGAFTLMGVVLVGMMILPKLF